MLWGVAVTALVAGVAVWMAILPVCGFDASGAEHCESKWAHFLASTPNEVGDTLAGFAGVLAFVWIIVTVWLQAQELSEQRQELANQREEMEGQRKASEEMAKAMAVQAEVFFDEKKRRDEEQARQELEELIQDVLSFHCNHSFPQWEYEIIGPGTRQDYGDLPIVNPWLSDGAPDQQLTELCEYIISAKRNIVTCFDDQIVSKRPELDNDLKELRVKLASIATLRDQLSSAQKVRFSRFGVEAAVDALLIMEAGDYWEATTP